MLNKLRKCLHRAKEISKPVCKLESISKRNGKRRVRFIYFGEDSLGWERSLEILEEELDSILDAFIEYKTKIAKD